MEITDEKITWQTLEFQPKKRSVDWYWAVAIAVLAGAIISIIYQNFLFAVFLLLAGVLMFIYGMKNPDEIEIEISDVGVRVDDHLFPYKNIEAFWVDDDGTEQKLLLYTNRPIMPLVVIPMENDTMDDIADFLLEFIPAEEMEEPFSHKVMDRLGF